MVQLKEAEEELEEKNRELAIVQARYDAAMKEKQVLILIHPDLHFRLIDFGWALV